MLFIGPKASTILMGVPLMSSIYELSLFRESGSEAIVAFLHELGIFDCVEASCDFLDSDEAEAEAILARFEAGLLNLPVIVYSYEEPFIQELQSKVHEGLGKDVQMKVRTIRNELWQEAWEPGFRFLETDRFVIGPENFTFSAPAAGKIHLRLASGTVFGSGQHATTQALVRLMERQKGVGGSFLDVGTGTGVLAFVADRLGYSDIWGTDIDEEAVAIARANAARNQIEVKLIAASLPTESRRWDTVACNILPPTLTRLLPALAERLQEKGRLLLAGFHEANQNEIRDALEKLSFTVKEEVRERGWIAWDARRV